MIPKARQKQKREKPQQTRASSKKLLHDEEASVYFGVSLLFFAKTMWYKTLSAIVSIALLTSQSQTFATLINDDLLARTDDVRDQIMMQEYQRCDLFDDALRTYNDNFEDHRYFMDDGWWDIDVVDMEESSGAVPLAAESDTMADGNISSKSSDEFSTTNLQKQGIDEPDILKSNGRHLYYVNHHLWSTQIIDPNTQEEVGRISLPKTLETQDLFLHENTLTLIMNRYSYKQEQSFRDRGQSTFVASFDISQAPRVSLKELYLIDGGYNDARMVDGELTMITTSRLHRWREYESIDTRQPRVMSIDAQRNFNLVKAGCEDFSALLPTEARHVPLTSMTRLHNNGEISMRQVLSDNQLLHMSDETLVLIHGLRLQDEYSVLHGFDAQTLDYRASNAVEGGLLTQYSVDAHSDRVRIVTSNRQRDNPQASTNIFVLDTETMNQVGELTEIEPGEEFQGVRFMGDMAYLVTFPTPRPFPRDPLFAIDMSSDTPRIIGELKIPGYSTYLHPLKYEGDSQYLIWLGYDVRETDQRDNPIRGWLKVDVYEVAFDQKETIESKCSKISSDEELYADCIESVDPHNIRVSQIDSVIVGGQWSRAEAMENPRTFVLKNDGTLLIPALINDITTQQRQVCETRSFDDGLTVERECREESNIIEDDPTAQLLRFDVDTQWVELKGQKDLTDAIDGHINDWTIRDQLMRAWYVGDTIFVLWQDFGYFMENSDEMITTWK